MSWCAAVGMGDVHRSVNGYLSTEQLTYQLISLTRGEETEQTVFISCSFIERGAFSDNKAVNPSNPFSSYRTYLGKAELTFDTHDQSLCLGV